MMPYKLHSLGIGQPDAAPDVIIGDLDSETLDMAPDVNVERSAGFQWPNHVSLMTNDTTLQLETFNIVRALNEVGMAGKCGSDGVTVYLAKYDACGKLEAGNVHRSYSFASGLIVPNTLTCNHRENARLQLQLYVLSADGASQITITDNAALPDQADVSTGDRWTLGSQTVATKALADYTGLELNFGQNIQKRGTQSDVADKYIEQFETSPEFALTGIDPTWFASTGQIVESGNRCEHTDTILYLRKKAQTATTFEPDATPVHVKFTLAGLAVVNQAFGANQNAFTESTLRLIGQYDDATGALPVIYTGDTAIT